jgi:hypothetical protein
MTSSSVLLNCANILLLGANRRLRLLLEDRLSYAALGRRKTAEAPPWIRQLCRQARFRFNSHSPARELMT